MAHQDLVNIALYVHGAVLLCSLTAWYKYGDRSDILAKSLEGTESTLSKLRKMISDDLLTTIKEVLSTAQTQQTNPILGPDGRVLFYSERDANFLKSEEFEQAITDFVAFKCDMLSGYRILIRARSIWCFWARVLSWSILLLIVLQILSLALHGYDKIVVKHLPDWSVHGTLIVTGCLVLIMFCLPFTIMLCNHDVIMKEKVKYDAP